MVWGVVIIFAIILGSVILHELAHGLMAYWLGDMTAKEEGRLTLNPLKHIDPFSSILLPMMLYLAGGPVFGGAKPVPINTRKLKWGEVGMALVAVAGPLTNLLLALVSFLVGHFSGWMYEGEILKTIFQGMVLINLGFFAFNMLPIPPLDGSRVLYVLAPDGVRTMMTNLEQRAGILIIFGMVMIFGTALGQITSAVIAGILHFFYFLVGVR
ncbi:MAG: site-2 protease family protein [Candidatus Saccharibacteria bacterium]|nr:site-2 protease family protein [Candidatus Saccharibacteria bacterium]